MVQGRTIGPALSLSTLASRHFTGRFQALQRPLAVITAYPVKPPFMNGSTAVHPNSLDENDGIFLQGRARTAGMKTRLTSLQDLWPISHLHIKTTTQSGQREYCPEAPPRHPPDRHVSFDSHHTRKRLGGLPVRQVLQHSNHHGLATPMRQSCADDRSKTASIACGN